RDKTCYSRIFETSKPSSTCPLFQDTDDAALAIAIVTQRSRGSHRHHLNRPSPPYGSTIHLSLLFLVAALMTQLASYACPTLRSTMISDRRFASFSILTLTCCVMETGTRQDGCMVSIDRGFSALDIYIVLLFFSVSAHVNIDTAATISFIAPQGVVTQTDSRTFLSNTQHIPEGDYG
ncbi:LOW QUALITY PROTEIN: hypothetical protein CVT26_008125, partial [Gymnopilus dilepis]